jgi:hypothetical protein
MRNFACALVLTLTMVGLTTAAEITVTGVIIKVEKKGEGDKLEYSVCYKTFPKKKGDKVEPVTKPVAKSCVVVRAKPSADDPKKMEKETLENGLANVALPTRDGDRGAVARITFDQDKGAITHILVLTLPEKK